MLFQRKSDAEGDVDVSDEEALLSSFMRLEGSNDGTQEPHSRRQSLLPSCSFVLTLVLSICFSLAIGALLGSRYRLFIDSDSFCISHTSQYSPVLEDVDIKYQELRFNGSFMNENVFRQSASPEVDEAWTSLGIDYRSVIVPDELAARSGLVPDQVQVSEKYGGGYPANVEGLHHLHCLNLLRRALYFNFDYYRELGDGAFKNDDRILRLHVTHCLDILRQQLMCTVDVGVLGQVWYHPSAPKPFVDFNTRHKCRNFDDVREWARQHQAPAIDTLPPDYLRPPAPGSKVFETIP